MRIIEKITKRWNVLMFEQIRTTCTTRNGCRRPTWKICALILRFKELTCSFIRGFNSNEQRFSTEGFTLCWFSQKLEGRNSRHIVFEHFTTWRKVQDYKTFLLLSPPSMLRPNLFWWSYLISTLYGCYFLFKMPGLMSFEAALFLFSRRLYDLGNHSYKSTFYMHELTFTG